MVAFNRYACLEYLLALNGRLLMMEWLCTQSGWRGGGLSCRKFYKTEEQLLLLNYHKFNPLHPLI